MRHPVNAVVVLERMDHQGDCERIEEKVARTVSDSVEPLTAADLRPIAQRLDVLIALLARVQPKAERTTLSERIRLLGQLGLDNAAVARVVGRGVDFVGVVRRRTSRASARRGGTKRARKATRRSRSARR